MGQQRPALGRHKFSVFKDATRITVFVCLNSQACRLTMARNPAHQCNSALHILKKPLRTSHYPETRRNHDHLLPLYPHGPPSYRTCVTYAFSILLQRDAMGRRLARVPSTGDVYVQANSSWLPALLPACVYRLTFAKAFASLCTCVQPNSHADTSLSHCASRSCVDPSMKLWVPR